MSNGTAMSGGLEMKGRELDNRGVALIYVLFLLLFLSAVAAVMLTASYNNARRSSYSADYEARYYAAESAAWVASRMLAAELVNAPVSLTTASGDANSISTYILEIFDNIKQETGADEQGAAEITDLTCEIEGYGSMLGQDGAQYPEWVKFTITATAGDTSLGGRSAALCSEYGLTVDFIGMRAVSAELELLGYTLRER